MEGERKRKNEQKRTNEAAVASAVTVDVIAAKMTRSQKSRRTPLLPAADLI